MKAYLHLENGMTFEGDAVGASKEVIGELTMDTLAGCQEELSNPANYGKLLCFTLPFAGTYGINTDDSSAYSAAGAIFHEVCPTPSNFRSTGTLEDYLKNRGITGIANIDTRKIVSELREHGNMNAIITKDTKYTKTADLKNFAIKNAVKSVSVKKPITTGLGGHNIAVLDLGVTNGLLNLLKDNTVTIFPFNTPFENIKAAKPDAVIIAGGPGSPDSVSEIFPTVKQLFDSKLPILAIGLGHNVLAASLAMKSKKLSHSQRGKYPIRNIAGKNILTACFAADYIVTECNKNIAAVSFSDIHADEIAGIHYLEKNVSSIQFQPESNEYDTHYLVTDFLKSI